MISESEQAEVDAAARDWYGAGYADGFIEAYNAITTAPMGAGLEQLLHHMFDFWQDQLAPWAVSGEGDLEQAPLFILPEHVVRKPIPRQQREQLIQAANFTCRYCHRQSECLRTGPDGRPWEIDHRLALARGGTHTPDNWVLACASCNGKKGSKR